jgi:hypothetical protein
MKPDMKSRIYLAFVCPDGFGSRFAGTPPHAFSVSAVAAVHEPGSNRRSVTATKPSWRNLEEFTYLCAHRRLLGRFPQYLHAVDFKNVNVFA